jgi:hypothetical protein
VTRKQVPAEALLQLRQRLMRLSPRSGERRVIMQETAALYGVAEVTLYRLLRERMRPRALRRADCGSPRVLTKAELEHYCELVAAIKLRTSNRKGRHLSTTQALRLLEDYGITVDNGHLQAPKGVLKKSTVNRYLKQWGLDRGTLMRQPPAVRFQARYSNQCWQFDLSPSDMKQLPAPPWIDASRGALRLMLYSVVDDRSGVAYQEYHCVYGEDVEAALRFLFNAMTPKGIDGFPFAGIPEMLYVDSGPITKSLIFQHVMSYLGIEVRPHMPQGSDGRRPTARAKGKVERPFRTVKEMHETLYHFHAPQTELEANAWLLNFLLRYNHMQHRTEPHSRFEDWLDNLPPTGIRKMCSWERFCTFAREPERRKVGVDARVSAEGTMYAVDPELAGETVVLWWGLFDNELYVEHGEERFGPYHPIGGPIPLHRYRRFKKSKPQQRADRIEALAAQLHLSRKALEDRPDILVPLPDASLPSQPFVDPDPFHEITFPSVIDAKRAIASYLGQPLAKLPPEQLDYINALVGETLQKQEVMARVRDYFKTIRGKSPC